MYGLNRVGLTLPCTLTTESVLLKGVIRCWMRWWGALVQVELRTETLKADACRWLSCPVGMETVWTNGLSDVHRCRF